MGVDSCPRLHPTEDPTNVCRLRAVEIKHRLRLTFTVTFFPPVVCDSENAGWNFVFPLPASQSGAAPTTWHNRCTNVALIAAQREAESELVFQKT